MYPYFSYTNNPYNYANVYRQNNTQFISDLQKAINGEYSAITCYEELAKMAPTEDERKQILEIRDDESRHLEMFSSIFTHSTGRKPTPEITEECEAAYKEGLVASFKDEQETVDFYLDIADRAHELFIKEAFRRAAADEQNHAVWFSFFLVSHK